MDIGRLRIRRGTYGCVVFFTVAVSGYAALTDYVLSKFGAEISHIGIGRSADGYSCGAVCSDSDACSVKDLVMTEGDCVEYRLDGLRCVSLDMMRPYGCDGEELLCCMIAETEGENLGVVDEIRRL